LLIEEILNKVMQLRTVDAQLASLKEQVEEQMQNSIQNYVKTFAKQKILERDPSINKDTNQYSTSAQNSEMNAGFSGHD
jgi:hypothetical protein